VHRLGTSLCALSVFGMGINVCQMDISPSGNTVESLLSRYETHLRLQKIRDEGFKVVSVWWFEFRKHSGGNPDLKNELCSHPYVEHSPINIRDAFTG